MQFMRIVADIPPGFHAVHDDCVVTRAHLDDATDRGWVSIGGGTCPYDLYIVPDDDVAGRAKHIRACLMLMSDNNGRAEGGI